MQNSLQPRFSVTRDLGVQYAYKPQNCPLQRALERRADEQFMDMLDAYRGTGGLARKEEILSHFKSFTLEPHPQLGPLFDELADVYEPLEMADWFAQPNPWLAGRAPVDTLLNDLTAVMHAARADRYIANG